MAGQRYTRPINGCGQPLGTRAELGRRDMLRTILVCLLFAGTCPVTLASTVVASRVEISNQRRVSFNDGWRFLKAEAEGAQDPGFDDSTWTEVRLPHDWAIDGPFD